VSSSAVLDEDQRSVYGPVPPDGSAEATISSPLRVAFTSACGPEPSTAGTWKRGSAPRSEAGLQV
jgi:hypothetical protein